MSYSNSRISLAFLMGGSTTLVFTLFLAVSAMAGSSAVKSTDSNQASEASEASEASDASDASDASQSEMISEELDPIEINRVLALSDDVAYGEYLAGECASCHSLDATAGSNVPVIHGAASEHIARALLEYRKGIRTNTTMVNVASSLGDEEVAVLSHYMASVGR
ncbi:MAG: cytochrome c [Granulosicoccus sp.]